MKNFYATLIVLVTTFLVGTSLWAQRDLQAQPKQFTTFNNAEQKSSLQNDYRKILWENESFGQYKSENEIAERRSENEKHFQREDGQVDMFVSSEPINFLENGKWKTIYNTIVEDNNGIYKFSNLNNTFKSYYPENIQDGFKTVINGQELLEMRNATMYYELNGQKMAVQEIESATGVANGNKLTYANVYGNAIDLLVTQKGGKRKLDYIIRDRAAINSNLSNAQYLVFSEEITLPHGWSAKLENGAIHLLNASGNVASLYEMPVVFDNNQNLPEKESKGTAEFDNKSDVVKAKMNSKGAIQNNEDIYISRNIAYEIELLGNKLTVLTKVELTYLLDENRVYPVIVDPTLTATHNPNSWSYSYGAPYGPPPITTSGAPAGSAITNTNVSFNALNNAYYFWGWNYYSGYCGSWHSYGLLDWTPGSPNYGFGPAAIINNCGGNTNWFNCNDPNRTWLSELISMDGYDYAAYYGFTVTVTYETVSAPTAINGTSTICAGSSTTLTASGGSASAGSTAITTQWFSGSCGGTLVGTGNSITVSPTSTTTYYVRRVGQCSTTGCASITIVVNQPPTAPTAVSSSLGNTICSGQTTILSFSGGSNGSGATYQWYEGGCGNGSVLGTGATLSVSPTSTTTYYVRRVGTSPCNGTTTGCESLTVTVNFAPTNVNAGADQTICAGSSVQFSGSATGPTISGSPTSVSETGLNVTIPDSNPTGISRTRTISNSNINASAITSVSLAITHTWNADLDIYLTSPSGFQIALSEDKGGSGNNYNCTFVTGGSALPTSSVSITGNVAPQSPFSSFTGSADGTWTLTIKDDAGGDLGTLTSWSINYTPNLQSTPTYSWAPSISLSNSNISNPVATPSTTTTYAMTATVNGCSASDDVLVTVDQPSTAATGITGAGSACLGTTSTLSVQGGSLSGSSNWEWYEGSCGGTVVGTGNSITVTPGSTTTYFVAATANGACAATTCASGTVTLPTPDNTLSVNNSAGTCTVNQNGWVHFLDANGRLLASINSNGQNLGNVTVTSYLEPAPLDVPACNNPSLNWITTTMARHWVITPQFQPSNPVIVRLPYDASSSGEYDQLFNAANSNLNDFDDIAGHNSLYLSKYSGPNNVNNIAADNCPLLGGSGGSTIYTQTNNGLVNSYSPIPIANARYVEYSIPNFSEFWIHGSSINSPLPVKMGEIDAYCNEHTNINTIKWTTLTETNSNLFTIEKTTDFSNWNFVTEVNGAGNSSTQKNYQIQDEGNIEDTYYRIIQKDFNGEEEVFGPIKVSCNANSNISIYPNPNNGVYSINIYSENGFEDGELQIFDMNGKLLKSEIISVSSGLNSLNTNISDFAPGSYMLVVKYYEHIYKPVRIVKTR